MELFKRHPLYKEDLSNVVSIEGIDCLQGKSFLITGATGLIGTHLVDALMSLHDVSVIAVGRDREKAKKRLGEYFESPLFKFIAHDAQAPFHDDIHVDYIIPCASNTHPLAYSQYPVETININYKGAENALELARRTGAVVLYPSSVEIYGEALGNEVFSENYTGKLNLSTARSCYSESKRVCEALCLSYMAEYGVDVKIARLSRVFGPTMLFSDSKASSQFIKNAVNGEDIVLKSKGNQFFSYTYVSDVVAAMLHILIWGESGVAYNISNQDCNVYLKDFASLCASCSETRVVFELPAESESKGYSIASRAILNNESLLDTGFRPKYTMYDAISRTIRILKNE